MEKKFRFWDTAFKLMIDGEYTEEYISPMGEVYEKILNSGFGYYEEIMENISDSRIIMQYIGKKDVNDIEIYESDIVNVVWENEKEERCESNIVIKNPFEYNIEEIMFISQAKKMKVIGNVYQGIKEND